jgi:hypothetical protein
MWGRAAGVGEEQWNQPGQADEEEEQVLSEADPGKQPESNAPEAAQVAAPSPSQANEEEESG